MLAGICEDDIDVFCGDVMPGLGRLAICLSDQLKEQDKQGYNGEPVSSECATELDKFKKDQSDNINLDLPLGMLASAGITHIYSFNTSSHLREAVCRAP